MWTFVPNFEKYVGTCVYCTDVDHDFWPVFPLVRNSTWKLGDETTNVTNATHKRKEYEPKPATTLNLPF